MKSLSKILLTLSTISLLSSASLNSYSQTKDTIPQQTQIEQTFPKKIKRFYKDMNFITNMNLNGEMKDFVEQCYGLEINLGRRFVDEFKLGLTGSAYWGSKKKDDKKDKQNGGSIGIEAIYSPFSEDNSDPFYVGAGLGLNFNTLKVIAKNSSDNEKGEIINLGYFVKIGGQIRLGKRSDTKLNLGVKYNYSQGIYEGDKADLSTFGFFAGISNN